MQSSQMSVSHVKDLIDILDTEYTLKAGVQPLNVPGEDSVIDQSVEKAEALYMDSVREAEVLDLRPPIVPYCTLAEWIGTE